MNRLGLSVTALVCAVALGAAPAAAQHARLNVGAGGVVPSGDYSSVDNAGWHLVGALELSLPRSPLAVRADVMYGQTSHQGATLLTGSTTLSGGSADAVYHFGAPVLPLRPYLLAGLGYYRVSISGVSESNVAFNGGAGLTLGVGPMKVFGEARYVSVLTSGGATDFFPVSVGLSFGM